MAYLSQTREMSHGPRVSASCTVELARVRAEPRDDAEQVTQLLCGEPVDVVETRDGWARIETTYEYPGWVRDESLSPVSGDECLAISKGDVLEEARRYLGSPYEWGGMTAAGIDCSGLIHMSFRRLGVLVPRDSRQQAEAGIEVAETDLRPGDIVCYEGHTAFWVAPGRILHATGRAGVASVVEEHEPEQLRTSFLSFRRLVTD
jgi:cell wall-associated NlpC family hydrolase